MGQLFSDAYNADPNVSVGVSRRLPNISISATSTPDQFSDAIQRLEARCVRLSQLKANAEALKTEEEEDEEPAASKRQTLVDELAGSIKSIQADIAVLKRLEIEAEAAAVIDGKFDSKHNGSKKKSRTRSEGGAGKK